MKFDISINEDGTRKLEFYHMDRSVTAINLDRATCKDLEYALHECERAEKTDIPDYSSLPEMSAEKLSLAQESDLDDEGVPTV